MTTELLTGLVGTSFLAIVFVVVAISIAGFWIKNYNTFITLKIKTDESWSGIDVQIKKRHNVIPNLVSAVKGYMKHEKKVLEDVTKLRTKSMEHSDPQAIMKTESMLTGALKTLFAVSEDYPDLKASKNFISLQEELAEIEDQISAARRIYNQNASRYNTAIKLFPANIVAIAHGKIAVEFFEIDQEDAKVPNVSF